MSSSVPPRSFRFVMEVLFLSKRQPHSSLADRIWELNIRCKQSLSSIASSRKPVRQSPPPVFTLGQFCALVPHFPSNKIVVLIHKGISSLIGLQCTPAQFSHAGSLWYYLSIKDWSYIRTRLTLRGLSPLPGTNRTANVNRPAMSCRDADR